MYRVSRYPHGAFSWSECRCPDAEAGAQFYSQLMDWEPVKIPIEDGEGDDYLFLKEGVPVAGLAAQPSDMPDAPATWRCYVTVSDVDALAGRIPELGGTVTLPPEDVADHGRMLLLRDPGGAELALWQAGAMIGAGFVNRPGAISWHERCSEDDAREKAFYGALLGWDYFEDFRGYTRIINRGRENGGILLRGVTSAAKKAAWSPYISVADIVRKTAQITELGGRVLDGPFSVGDVGTYIVFADAQGARACMIQLAQPEPWRES